MGRDGMRVWTIGFCVSMIACLGACDVYDPDLVEKPSGGKDGGADGGKDSGTDGDVCMDIAETCNRRDDNCNGRIDEEPAASAYCETVVVNAVVDCVNGACVSFMCNEGFWDCDGEPSNGCEKRFCDCHTCDDAGADDGGADDGGN